MYPSDAHDQSLKPQFPGRQVLLDQVVHRSSAIFVGYQYMCVAQFDAVFVGPLRANSFQNFRDRLSQADQGVFRDINAAPPSGKRQPACQSWSRSVGYPP